MLLARFAYPIGIAASVVEGNDRHPATGHSGPITLSTRTTSPKDSSLKPPLTVLQLAGDFSSLWYKQDPRGPSHTDVVFRVDSAIRVKGRDILTYLTGIQPPHDFEDDFSDLAHAARDAKSYDLSLSDFESQLDKTPLKQLSDFEAFGMKFPLEQVTLWGTIVVLAIQLYFYVYLSELSRKMQPTDAGWDVPWVALVPSTFARAIFFVTVVVLPVSAQIAIAFHWEHVVRFGRFFEQYVHWGPKFNLAVIGFVGLSLSLIASISLSLLSWKNRPSTLKSLGGPA
jgi:hypothetical protein